MLFTSLEFLFYFLPITLILCYLIPRSVTWQNICLLLMSLLFYAWGEPTFVLIMIGSIILNFLGAVLIQEVRPAGRKKAALAVFVVLDLAVLFVFKYMNFVVSTLRGALPGFAAFVPQTHIVLPIGISFFTFQAVSYLIDVYRGIPAQDNLVSLGLYISLFPQLIAGPIVRYTTVMDQIEDRRLTATGFCLGFERFIRGFSKKVLFSNVFSEVAEAVFGSSGMSVSTAWIGAIAYTLQIYFDFSGYSDMAIGLGRIFGFEFSENFDYPYISKTITEFWRRWHISLGSWFRDYVYFPLGGSRVKSKWKLIRNLAVVWLLTGIWHGANWTFILWGVLYGVIIIFEKLTGIPKKLDRAIFPIRWIYWLFTMVMVILGWVLFNSADIGSAVEYIRCMFDFKGDLLIDGTALYYLHEYRVFWVLGCIAATPLFRWLRQKLSSLGTGWCTVVNTVSSVTQAVLFLIAVTCLVMNAHNPFIYFNF